MASVSKDLKRWGVFDTTCGHKAKDITPSTARRREAWEEEALDDLPWKDDGGPSSVRRPLELYRTALEKCTHLYDETQRTIDDFRKDNLTVFSYSGRVKSPEWRWQRRRADLRHFEIFRHGPIIIYTRLPAGGTYYLICMFPVNSECLIGISDAFSAFRLQVSVIFPTCSLYPQQKRAYFALHPQACTYIYRSMPEGSYRMQSPGFLKIVYLGKGAGFWGA